MNVSVPAREMRDLAALADATAARSVVFGMPMEAIKRGGASKVLSLDSIAREIGRLCAVSQVYR